MLRAIAIDDEPPALKVIATFCKSVAFVELKGTFTNTEEARKFIESTEVELVLLDINMPSISGIDFYKNLSKKPMLIFTTAYSHFAIDGFNLSAVDYLLKPFTFARFLQALEKAKNLHVLTIGFSDDENTKEKYLILRINYALTKILFVDILYIEGLDDYLKIHLKQGKTIVARLTMKAMTEKLPGDMFARVHRSYIVSLEHVESVRNKVISIANEEIPISSSFEASFLAVFKG